MNSFLRLRRLRLGRVPREDWSCKKFSFDEMQTVPGWLVYGLNDDAGLFYIGQTRTARVRFSHYADGTGASNWAVAERLQKSKGRVYVTILSWFPKDLDAMEAALIVKHGASLLNLKENPYSRLPSREHEERLKWRDARFLNRGTM